jgi:hypothetical protein
MLIILDLNLGAVAEKLSFKDCKGQHKKVKKKRK